VRRQTRCTSPACGARKVQATQCRSVIARSACDEAIHAYSFCGEMDCFVARAPRNDAERNEMTDAGKLSPPVIASEAKQSISTASLLRLFEIHVQAEAELVVGQSG